MTIFFCVSINAFVEVAASVIPFKDQASANVVKKCITDLSSTIKTTFQPVFNSRKLNEDLKVREVKTATVNHNVSFINFNVTCAMQDMLVTQRYSLGELAIQRL